MVDNPPYPTSDGARTAARELPPLADDSRLELTDGSVIEDLIADLTSGVVALNDSAITQDLVCDGDIANRILKAAAKPKTQLVWAGQTTTDWVIEELKASLAIIGPVHGNLTLVSLDGNLDVDGQVRGKLTVVCIDGIVNIGGLVDEALHIVGPQGPDRGEPAITGELNVYGSIGGELSVGSYTSIGGDLTIDESGSVESYLAVLSPVGGNLTIKGTVKGHLSLRAGASVLGDLTVTGGIPATATEGSIGSFLEIDGCIKGLVSIEGKVGGYLRISESGSVCGQTSISGSVGGYVSVLGVVEGRLLVGSSASVVDRLAVSGRAAEIVLFGWLKQEVTLTPGPGDPVPLLSLVGARFDDEVFVGERVRIDDCDFRQCADLAKLRLIGTDLFPEGPVRLASAPSEEHSLTLRPVPDAEMAAIYRQLRSNLESRSDRPLGRPLLQGGDGRPPPSCPRQLSSSVE